MNHTASMKKKTCKLPLRRRLSLICTLTCISSAMACKKATRSGFLFWRGGFRWGWLWAFCTQGRRGVWPTPSHQGSEVQENPKIAVKIGKYKAPTYLPTYRPLKEASTRCRSVEMSSGITNRPRFRWGKKSYKNWGKWIHQASIKNIYIKTKHQNKHISVWSTQIQMRPN